MKANGILQSLVFTSILSLFDLVSGQDGEHPEVRIHTRCKNKDDFMLTFHDGPSLITGQILETLKNEKVTATLFFNGNFESEVPGIGRNCIYNYARVIQEAHKAGHTIGSHTWSHVKLDKTLDDPRLKNEIEWVETAFKDILGFWPLLLSPPSNYTDSPDVLAKVAHDYDYTIISNNLDAREKDYGKEFGYSNQVSAKAKEQFLRFVQQNPRPESGISISRDLWQGNPTDVLPDAIEILRKAGFKFVDAKTCLGLENIYEPAEGRDLNALTLPDLKPRWADKSVACEVHLNLAK